MKLFNKSILFILAAFLLFNACDSTEDSPVDEGNNDTGDHVLTVNVTGAHTFSYNSDLEDLDYYLYKSESPYRRELTFFTKNSTNGYDYTFKIVLHGADSKLSYDVSDESDVSSFDFIMNKEGSNFTYSANLGGNISFTEITDTTLIGTFNINAYDDDAESEYINLSGSLEYSGTPVIF